ncbi:type II secretion system protein [Sulfuriferula multivorans]|uniref:type II secretion system protein n=1 Tax=Sulfuriferula multivorans TaxID=1559896 RepID=UPI000F5BB64F|nr:type II secretion system protein [Sulfuriferula multivorans]
MSKSAPVLSFPLLSARGFTLIEMAIVLIILTLVVGGALVPLGAQIEQRQRAETQRTLDEIREALIGYTLTHGVLPCPSTVSAGIPDGNANLNTKCGLSTYGIATGYIPWVTLGVNNKDAWNNLIRYAVATKFADTSNPFTLDTTSLNSTNTITIQTRDTTGTIVTISSTIPATVFSLGKNGYGALSADFIAQSSVPASNLDENQNITSGSLTYFSRTPAPAGTAATVGGEFDDMVVWISPNILYNRMVAAGKLP